MAEKQGIEIDYCPKCRGIWLDRGELEKIIERSDSSGFASPQDRDVKRHHDDDHRYYPRDKDHYYKRKKNFLSDMFDF